MSKEAEKAIIEKIETMYKKHFPHSVTYKNAIMGRWYVMCFLGDKESFSNGIEHNDPMRHSYSVQIEGEDVIIQCKDCSLSHIKPAEGSYLYCETRSLTFRKKKGTEKRVLELMEKHFQKLREFVDVNKKDMLDPEKYSKF